LSLQHDEGPETSDDDILHKSVRQIVLSRETIPRAPRWASAFRRTLLRFVRDITDAETASSDEAAPKSASTPFPPEETCHDSS
jgi:hypothetical protein